MADFTGRRVDAWRLRWGKSALIGLLLLVVGGVFLTGSLRFIMVGVNFAIIHFLVGCVGIAFGTRLFLQRRAWAARAITTRDRGTARRATVEAHEATSIHINHVYQYRLVWSLDQHRAHSTIHPLRELKPYPVGSEVTVYVDPARPGEMVWEGDCGLPHGDTAGSAPADPDVGGPPDSGPTVRRG